MTPREEYEFYRHADNKTRQIINDLSMAKSCLLVAKDYILTFKNTDDPEYIKHTKTMIVRAEKRMKQAEDAIN